MAANKQQGRYLTLFWVALTALCAGLAYLTAGIGKLILVLGLAGAIFALLGFMRIKSQEGKAAGSSGSASLKLAGLALTWFGWIVTMAGLGISSSATVRLVFALVGIGASLIGILGVLPVAFGRTSTAKAEAPTLKATLEHGR